MQVGEFLVICKISAIDARPKRRERKIKGKKGRMKPMIRVM